MHCKERYKENRMRLRNNKKKRRQKSMGDDFLSIQNDIKLEDIRCGTTLYFSRHTLTIYVKCWYVKKHLSAGKFYYTQL